jgi:hypothetical protein
MKVNMNSNAMQATKVAFQAAILAGDKVAELAYVDWLEEMGSTTEAAKLRRKLDKQGQDGRTAIQDHVRYELIGKAERLIVSQTAIKEGYFGQFITRGNLTTLEGGFLAAARNGYVPTLRKGKALQKRLGDVLTALGHKVFFIS